MLTREGGSIPVAASFESILGLPVVLLGFAQPHENAHAPDEWMDLANYEGAIRAIVRHLRRDRRARRQDCRIALPGG